MATDAHRVSPPALRVGLTGGIASGKSTVAAGLAARGALLIDTDAIAHALTAPGGAAIAPLRAAFGETALDAHGALDRARMRTVVFADPRLRSRLESILHPLILERCLQLAQLHAARSPVLLFDIPLLAEAPAMGQALRLDRVLVIDCPRSLQVARATARATLPAGLVQAVIDSQATRAQRLDLADDVLFNGGSLAQLQAAVEQLWEHYGRTQSL